MGHEEFPRGWSMPITADQPLVLRTCLVTPRFTCRPALARLREPVEEREANDEDETQR